MTDHQIESDDVAFDVDDILDQSRRDYRADPCCATAIPYLEAAMDYADAGAIDAAALSSIQEEVSRWDTSRPLCEYLDGTSDPYAQSSAEDYVHANAS